METNRDIKGFRKDPRRCVTFIELEGKMRLVSVMDIGRDSRPHPQESFDYRSMLSDETRKRLEEYENDPT